MRSERGRSRRTYLIVALVISVTLVGGATALSQTGGGGKGGVDRADGLPPSTDPVKRQDLSSRTQVDGTSATPRSAAQRRCAGHPHLAPGGRRGGET